MKPALSDNAVEIEGQFYAKNHPKAIAHRQAKPVAGLYTTQPKSDFRRKVENSRVEASAISFQYRVTFTVYRKRLLDVGDNGPSALKPTRDAVANFLGLDDNDPRITWDYQQIQARRDSGTHILIEMTR